MGFFGNKPSEVGDSALPEPSSGGARSLAHLSERMSDADTIRTLSFWICFLICASLIADLNALLVEKYLPSPPVSILASRSLGGAQSMSGFLNYEIINDRNLFSSKANKKEGNSIDLEAAPVPTTLNYQLVGTVIFRNPARSLAAIQDKGDGKLYPVRIGDMIGDNVQIVSVEARKVIFINSTARRKEFLEIPEDPAIKISAAIAKPRPAAGGINQLEENRFVIGRQEIDSQMANFNALLTQARAVPELRGGQMVGFRLTQIVPNSFYQKAGFKDGDVIRSVNGEKVTDAGKAFELLQGLKSMSSLDMTIERGGKEVNFNYDIR